MSGKRHKEIRREVKQRMDSLPNNAGFKDRFGNVINKVAYERIFLKNFKRFACLKS